MFEVLGVGGELGLCPKDGATKLSEKLHTITQAEFTHKIDGVKTEEDVKQFLFEVAKLAETQIQKLEMSKALLKNV